MSLVTEKKRQLVLYSIPLAGWLLFALQHELHWKPLNILLIAVLFLCISEAVHHAEVIAHRIGQPFGSMVLALAVTSIEVSLIVALMLAGGPEASALARDTVFAAVMIILNLMVGLSILVGGIKHNEQSFVLQGANAALIILVAISVFSFILPNYTQTVVGPYYSNKQLVFVAIVTLILYGSFIFVQNIKHRSHFLTEFEMGEVVENRPSAKATATSTLLLFVCLGAVVVLAESLAPSLEEFIQAIGAPHSLAGVIIACVVLLPEGLTAFKAAKQNQLQKSLNLSLGSAVASIGLTIPIVSLLAVFSGLQLTLGINAESSLLFVLSLFTIILSLSTGKTTILHGIVLLVIFMVYLFMLIFP